MIQNTFAPLSALFALMNLYSVILICQKVPFYSLFPLSLRKKSLNNLVPSKICSIFAPAKTEKPIHLDNTFEQSSLK